jgi:L-threonylcarbamoyladenylate synthase
MITHNLQSIVDALEHEDIAAIPTETVYGLAGKATSYKAVAKIYQLKGRPSFNPLIVHISSCEQIEKFAIISPDQKACIDYFWSQKKPLTVVLNLKDNHPLTPLVTAGLSTVAIRMPHHSLALEIIMHTGPLAAPSANVSNNLSPTTAEHVSLSFKEKAPLILNGGECRIGVESTILNLASITPQLLRAGGLSKEALEDYFKCEVPYVQNDKPNAPGQLSHHYSPGCPVILNEVTFEKGSVLLGFGPDTPSHAAFNLSQTGNLDEAAHNLFTALHKLALMNPKSITVMPIPKEGLGLAINDRLQRAASTK